MSRSRKKTSISSNTTAESEKKDKRFANRSLRRRVRAKLQGSDSEELSIPHLREVSNVWSMKKDGKNFFDPKKFPREMRK